MNGHRAVAIAALVPLERLDTQPYLVDIRSQFAHCAQWAAARGHTLVREVLAHGLVPAHEALWDPVDSGEADLFVVAEAAALAEAVHPAEEFRALCELRGVPLALAALPEPPLRRRPQGPHPPQALDADRRLRRPLNPRGRSRASFPGGNTSLPPPPRAPAGSGGGGGGVRRWGNGSRAFRADRVRKR
ncbi:hypothetical protein GA0115246_105932 [Streptomyces sp. SolWspMP-sol7th]|nr:hypothetical protein GA0115246_105932 [Streptomyces sp. SolWspMP-sol7th]